MGMERVTTFEALIDRASVLLERSESCDDSAAADEGLLLLHYVQNHFSSPFSADEIAGLLTTTSDTPQSVRALLETARLKRLLRDLANLPSDILTAAE